MTRPATLGQLKESGYEVLPVKEEIRRNAIKKMAAEHPKVVEEIVPKLLSLGLVHRIFQNLLRERISIRDAATILEAAGEASLTTKNVILITEYVRQAIRRSVVEPFLDRDETLKAYMLDASLDEAVASAVQHGEVTSHLSLAPNLVREFMTKIQSQVGAPATPVAVIVSSGARYFFQQLAESALKNVFFLAHGDLPPSMRVVSLGVIR